MMRGRAAWVGAVVCSGMVIAGCAGDKNTPLAPSGGSGGSGAAVLKVSAPVVVSPANGQTSANRTPTLVWQRATGAYAQPQVSYEIQVTSPAGDLVYTRTVPGGPADGQGTVSHQVEVPLAAKAPYRWRARAVAGGDAGPWSSDPASGPTMFSTTSLTPASSNDEFRDYFFAVIAERGVGPTPSASALRVIEPDLVAVGIIVQKDSAGNPRGRLYLPTGATDKFARSVDIVTGFGGNSTWKWLVIGATKCEGICP
jgi:hypothetical protein